VSEFIRLIHTAADRLAGQRGGDFSIMMDRALDAVVRRVKTIARKHDIPYLAGYSQDGEDHLFRPSVTCLRRSVMMAGISTPRYPILHEEVEKTLIDQLKLYYLHAHQIATRAEQAAVRAAGPDRYELMIDPPIG
jgi:hypothetical protein